MGKMHRDAVAEFISLYIFLVPYCLLLVKEGQVPRGTEVKKNYFILYFDNPNCRGRGVNLLITSLLHTRPCLRHILTRPHLSTNIQEQCYPLAEMYVFHTASHRVGTLNDCEFRFYDMLTEHLIRTTSRRTLRRVE